MTEGLLPTAHKALRDVRLISIVQCTSEVNRNSNMSDSDKFLLDLCTEKNKSAVYVYKCNNSTTDESKPVFTKFTIYTYTLNELFIHLTQHDANCCFHIAGNTTNAVRKQVCQ